jgi:hypothetical protein
MSALDPPRPERLAELLLSAATLLTESQPARGALSPAGIPVRRGRLHLGRLRHVLSTAESVAVTAGFATAAWLGPRDVTAPDLGRLAYRTETCVDGRGRIVLDLRVRAWLGIEHPMAFDVVAVPAPEGGLLVVPVEDFARRWEVISS